MRNESATIQVIRETAVFLGRKILPAIGAMYLLAAMVHALGGPCILPGAIVCTF